MGRLLCLLVAAFLWCPAAPQTQSETQGGTTGTIQSQGFGGLQLGSGILSQESCNKLKEANKNKEIPDVLPCECRTFPRDDEAAPCYPNCCPKSKFYSGSDRCHEENAQEWSVYEQLLCRPSTTQQNYPGDGVCVYNGGNPIDVNTQEVGDKTKINFKLSKQAPHRCDDLLVSPCFSSPQGTLSDFRYKTVDGKVCWQTCPPAPIAKCTKLACHYNRGRTHPFIRSWKVPLLSQGVYMLSCMTTATREYRLDYRQSGATSEVNQTQFLPTAFYVP